jgi:periplasmic protein TonB
VSGKVIIKFVCSKEGIPTNISVTMEKPQDMGFGEVAIKAIEQARFKPGMQRDKPVPVRMSQKIDFKTNLR